jgi:hypothetical protein
VSFSATSPAAPRAAGRSAAPCPSAGAIRSVLDTTPAAVNSSLQRARQAVEERLPAWFLGREAIGRFFAERMFGTPWRLVPIRANGKPGFACFQGEPPRALPARCHQRKDHSAAPFWLAAPGIGSGQIPCPARGGWASSLTSGGSPRWRTYFRSSSRLLQLGEVNFPFLRACVSSIPPPDTPRPEAAWKRAITRRSQA